MVSKYGGRATLRDAGDALPNEQPTKELNGEFWNDTCGQPQDAPPSAIDAVDLVRFDFIAEAMDFVASYATSAREAAHRGNHKLLKVHTDQAKQPLDAALEVEAELGSLDTAA